MAATGKTPILLYGSTTATNTPSAGNLTNSSDGCEIAINVADKNLFFKDSTNAVNTVPIRQSSASSNGWLSSTDWSTFNSKQPAGTYVTSVTGTAPVVSSGGTTPAISMAAATSSVNGYLTSTDWSTFNGKQAALISGTNIKTVSGTTLLGSGDLGTIGTGYGGTGLASFTANGVVYASSTSALATGSTLTYNGTSLGIGLAAPSTIGCQIASNYNFSWQQSASESIGNIYQQYSSFAPTLANGYKRNTTGTDKFVSSYASSWARSAIAADYGAVYIYADAAATVAVGTAITPTEIAKFDSSGNVTIKNGNLVIGTSGKGIDFSATAGTGTSELLADYEEGTFTPAIAGGSTVGTGTYSVQIGRYTKIGRVVFFNIVLVWSAHTGSGTSSYVSGLPYTSVNVTSNDEPVKLNCSNYALTAANVMTGYVGYNSTNIILQQMPTGGGAIASVSLDTAASLWISGSYSVT